MKMLRPMQAADIDAVVDVIDSHDDDDAAEARVSFEANGGIEDQYVLEQAGRIIGITGYATPPGCDQTHWLSWTYVHDDFCDQGLGRQMITELIDHLRDLGGRKLFIKVSDYAEKDDAGNMVCIYAAALHLYKSLGFTEEIVLNNYYDDGETMTILGMRIATATSSDVNDQVITAEKPKVQFNSIFEISETDDAYSFGWHADAKRQFDVADVKLGLEDVQKRDGRAVFLSFPHNYEQIADTLLKAGFSFAGMLEDYFEDGIHEKHFVYNI